MGMFHRHSRGGKRLQRKPKSEHHPGVRLAALLLCLSMLTGFLPALARAADNGEKLSSIVTFDSICTMSYYDVCETWWGDCVCGGEGAIADKLGIDSAEVCEMIGKKLDPLSERLTAEFRQSPEYIAKQEHERIRADYLEASSKFCSRYDVDKDDFARCYDIFLTLRNPEYLAQIKSQHKARKESERRYRESWSSTYERYTSGGYSVPSASTYGESERAILKKFYRSLSKTYHPDLNPDEDTTEAMKLLNKLKEQWGV